MKKWNLIPGLLILTLCIGITYGEDAEKTLFNDKCPISNRAVDETKTSDYKVEFCCENCQSKFEKDPAKFLPKAAETEAGTCIISGQPAKVSTTLNIGFCCGNCKGKFDKEPKKFIGKVKPAEKTEE